MPDFPTVSISESANLAATRNAPIRPLSSSDSRAHPDHLPAEWGEYDGIELIGEGGMGFVYKARHKQLNRVEALKMLRSGEMASGRELDRFRFEAEAAAGLNHPNIVEVLGIGEVNGAPYFAMRWVDGGSLTDAAARLRDDPRTAAGVLAKVARAIQHAHERGILHRDLKPSNILLDTHGEPHVTDFGLAKRADEVGGMTITGAVVGTPTHMAPEQARGEKVLTTSVDVHGLGTILYEILTGHAPFLGRSLPELLRKVTGDPPVAPRSVNPAADPDLEAVCLKCLEKVPRDRYRSAADVAEELERVARGEPVSVRPPTLFDWAVREVTKTPEVFPGYVWQVKIWFGVIMVLAQLAIFGFIRGEWSVGWVWAASVWAWGSCVVALQWTMAKKFTRLPVTEQHSVMIAVGHVLAHVALTATCLPFTGPSDTVLSLYPAYAALSGLAFFTVGTTHWGRFYWYGLGTMALAPVLALWPTGAPVLYGIAVAAIMWHWAYAVGWTFAKEAGEQG